MCWLPIEEYEESVELSMKKKMGGWQWCNWLLKSSMTNSTTKGGWFECVHCLWRDYWKEVVINIIFYSERNMIKGLWGCQMSRVAAALFIKKAAASAATACQLPSWSSSTVMRRRMLLKLFWSHYCTLPSMRRSWPWLPMRVFERKGAKSIMISLSRGQTVPRATWYERCVGASWFQLDLLLL